MPSLVILLSTFKVYNPITRALSFKSVMSCKFSKAADILSILILHCNILYYEIHFTMQNLYLLEFLAEAFQRHVYHFQCLVVLVEAWPSIENGHMAHAKNSSN